MNFRFEQEEPGWWIVIVGRVRIGRVTHLKHGWGAITMRDAAVAVRSKSRQAAAEALYCQRFGNPCNPYRTKQKENIE